MRNVAPPKKEWDTRSKSKGGDLSIGQEEQKKEAVMLNQQGERQNVHGPSGLREVVSTLKTKTLESSKKEDVEEGGSLGG